MLIEREDVRNRIVSMAGHASLVTTTKAFAEAGQRISRYLLMQLIINASTGLAVWLGLYLIGVPYAVLWGLIAAVLRYVPYVGIWIAALFPITLSLIITPDWTDVAMVFGLFLALELLVGNFIEPWLYGHSVGLSPIAVILAVIFWTWIWGAVGLVLATPLTVCLVVIGKYISGFAIFGRLLGVGSSLEPHLWLYQRLLARDEKEAAEVLEEFAAEHTLEATCEQLLLPALLVLKRDVANGRIDATDSAFVAEALGEIVTELPRKSERTTRRYREAALASPPRVMFFGLSATKRFRRGGARAARGAAAGRAALRAHHPVRGAARRRAHRRRRSTIRRTPCAFRPCRRATSRPHAWHEAAARRAAACADHRRPIRRIPRCKSVPCLRSSTRVRSNRDGYARGAARGPGRNRDDGRGAAACGEQRRAARARDQLGDLARRRRSARGP